MEQEEDNEQILVVQEDPLVLMVKLPDGCTPGRWEAAVAFAESLADIRTRYPGKTFQTLPFSFSDGRDSPALDAFLAIANG